jgi:hypothetical protein
MASPAPTLRPGDQLASAGCTARVIVIKAPAQGRPLITCAGRPMLPATASPSASPPASAPVPAAGGGTLIGKRYVNADETVELLCTASGAGELRCDGVPMTRRAAKALPASD